MNDTLHEAAPAAGGGTIDLGALARGLLEDCLNAIMEEQASEMAEATGIQRNGCRERTLDTSIGAPRAGRPRSAMRRARAGSGWRRWRAPREGGASGWKPNFGKNFNLWAHKLKKLPPAEAFGAPAASGT